MLLLRSLRHELSGLLELFFPTTCPWCGTLPAHQDEQNFCLSCSQDIQPVSSPYCPRCLLPYPPDKGHNHLCQSCLLEPPPFLKVESVGLYQGALRQAVHRFKYRGEFSLDRSLGNLMGKALETSTSSPTFRADLLVPVPLHQKRLRERGYNQSLLLARVLGCRWKIPVSSRFLVRIRPTLPQQGLKAAERRRNLRGAFQVRGSLDGEKVLLIDDVMTTGATAHECSRSLLTAGAGEVCVAVLGRARLHGF